MGDPVDKRDAAARRIRRVVPSLALFFIVTLILLVIFADRDGYEGDDLNSILPMAHLTAAKQGLLLIYRYAWQPLSYEVGAGLWRLFGTPTAIFLSAPVSGAIALTGLLALALAETPARERLWLGWVALLGVPEFWFSALYYNSTIIGLPAAVGALALLRWRDGIVSAAIAGIAIGIAILMRMDFVLICPLLAVVAWMRSRVLFRPIVLAGAVVATLLLGWATGLIDPHALAMIQSASTAEIKAKAHMPGWDMRMKLGVASVSLSPIGWLLLIAGTPLLLVRAVRERRWAVLLWVAAALPAFYPLLNILSPKYMLPIAIFLPLLFVHGAAALVDWRAAHDRRAWQGLLITVAVLPIFVSLSFLGHAPFLQPGFSPRRLIPTHDGMRGYGGYLWQMAETDGPSAKLPAQKEAWALYDRFRAGESLVVVGSENYFDHGGVGWRHLQLRLERAGIHGALIAPHMLRFTNGAASLLLADNPPPILPAGATLIDLRGGADQEF